MIFFAVHTFCQTMSKMSQKMSNTNVTFKHLKNQLPQKTIDPSQEMGSVCGVPAYCCCHGQKYKR